VTDLMATLGTDPQPPTTEPVAANPAPPPVPPATDFTTGLPPGVHPLDNSVPVVPGMPIDADTPINQDGPGAQGKTRTAPWSTDNEQALPVYQRAASEWSANSYTLNSTSGPIQLAGKRKGQVSVTVWVSATASHGVVISPNQGDIQQGAGIELDPGDSITLDTEAAIWGGVIVGQTAGSVNVVVLYNPPGGGLGLSAG
jgi:hypothetical protein